MAGDYRRRTFAGERVTSVFDNGALTVLPEGDAPLVAGRVGTDLAPPPPPPDHLAQPHNAATERRGFGAAAAVRPSARPLMAGVRYRKTPKPQPRWPWLRSDG